MSWGFDDYQLQTLAVRAGVQRTNEGEQGEPIFTTSSFVFSSAAEAAARFSGEIPGNVYSRFTNPTVKVFEEKLAAMEGGEHCVATSSGMSAILATGLALLSQGDHIVASRSIFGTTSVLFDKFFKQWGIETTFVNLTDIDAWRQAIKNNTKMLFLETPSNPLTEVADVPELAALAHEHDALLVVDNVLCTPALQRPLTQGADIVVHSATKYIDGQGRCLGGAVVGDQELVGEGVRGFLRTAGVSMSPFNAWVFLKGLETLSLRMKTHCANAAQLAEFLEQHPKVARVHYPGLASHPHHELATRQQAGYGGLLSFILKGGKEAAWQLIDGTTMVSITANLGDAKTMITHPATTTHSRLTPEARAEAGIEEGLVRIAVGLEEATDIIADISQALDAVKL